MKSQSDRSSYLEASLQLEARFLDVVLQRCSLAMNDTQQFQNAIAVFVNKAVPAIPNPTRRDVYLRSVRVLEAIDTYTAQLHTFAKVVSQGKVSTDRNSPLVPGGEAGERYAMDLSRSRMKWLRILNDSGISAMVRPTGDVAQALNQQLDVSTHLASRYTTAVFTHLQKSGFIGELTFGSNRDHPWACRYRRRDLTPNPDVLLESIQAGFSNAPQTRQPEAPEFQFAFFVVHDGFLAHPFSHYQHDFVKFLPHALKPLVCNVHGHAFINGKIGHTPTPLDRKVQVYRVLHFLAPTLFAQSNLELNGHSRGRGFGL